ALTILMRPALRYIIFSGISFLLPAASFDLLAQERCGTVAYTKTLHENRARHQVNFENWLSAKGQKRAIERSGRRQAEPYQIPVVIHVIHNGEPVGVGANISNAQILSQIRVLNADFQRQNADAADTPAAFASVAGSL